MRRRISSDRVVLGSETLRIEPASIVIEGPHIVAIEDRAATSDDTDELDFGDKLITPAFVNAHTHLALGFLRGVDLRQAARGNMVEDFFFHVETKLSPEDIRAFARMGAYESLLHGVGLVWDHYYEGEQIAEALLDVGLCGVVAPTLQDLSGPRKDAHDEQLAATVRIDEASRYRSAGIYAAVGPHATDTVSMDLLTTAASVAEAKDLPLHMHVAQSVEEHRRARQRHGTSPLRWLLEPLAAVKKVFAHCLYADEADHCAVKAHDVCLVFCPFSQLVFGFPAAVRRWMSFDIPWAIATDCAANNDSMNVQQELRFVAGLRTAATAFGDAYASFQRGDDGSAEALWRHRGALMAQHERLGDTSYLLGRVWDVPGRQHDKVRAGCIESGALANLVVWDLDHPSLWPALDPLHVLCMADAAPAIWAMVTRGLDVGTAGDFHNSIVRSAEYRDAHREAAKRLAALDLG